MRGAEVQRGLKLVQITCPVIVSMGLELSSAWLRTCLLSTTLPLLFQKPLSSLKLQRKTESRWRQKSAFLPLWDPSVGPREQDAGLGSFPGLSWSQVVGTGTPGSAMHPLGYGRTEWGVTVSGLDPWGSWWHASEYWKQEKRNVSFCWLVSLPTCTWPRELNFLIHFFTHSLSHILKPYWRLYLEITPLYLRS